MGCFCDLELKSVAFPLTRSVLACFVDIFFPFFFFFFFFFSHDWGVCVCVWGVWKKPKSTVVPRPPSSSRFQSESFLIGSIQRFRRKRRQIDEKKSGHSYVCLSLSLLSVSRLFVFFVIIILYYIHSWTVSSPSLCS